MKIHPSQDIGPALRDLLAMLDQDLERIERSLQLLEALRTLVIKRDEAGLTALLDSVRNASALGERHAAERRALCQRLGRLLGQGPNATRLSDLLPHLHGSRRRSVEDRQRRLRDRIDGLQRHWDLTQALLRDCARLNHRLWQALFAPNGSATYGPRGTRRHCSETSLLDLQF